MISRKQKSKGLRRGWERKVRESPLRQLQNLAFDSNIFAWHGHGILLMAASQTDVVTLIPLSMSDDVDTVTDTVVRSDLILHWRSVTHNSNSS